MTAKTPWLASTLLLLALGAGSCHKKRRAPGTTQAAMLVTVGPRPTIAGSTLTPPLQVRLLDSNGSLLSGFNDNVTVSIRGGSVGANLSGSLSVAALNGVVTFYDLSIDKSGSDYQLVFAVASLATATTPFPVIAAAPTGFSVTPDNAAPLAGATVAVTIAPTDRFGNVVTHFQEAVTLSSSDLRATFPASFQFVAADQGVRTINATLQTSGAQSLMVRDADQPEVRGTRMFDVQPGATAGFALAGLGTVVSQGAALPLTLTAQDAFANRTPSYRGTVGFTSNDPQATLPINYTFTAADNGQHVFTPGVTFQRLGSANLQAAQVGNPGINASRTPIVADPGGWTPTSLVGAPAARGEHSAVWTGTEMIIWGGVSTVDHCATDTGARYNPVTDTWVATSRVNTPFERSRHEAVWTGTEMLVWGGGYYLDSGGRYNPATDTWQPMSVVGAPQGRVYFSAVWTGTEMIVWGGEAPSTQPTQAPPKLNTGGRYNPATDTWQPVTLNGAPGVRFLHTAVWTGSEMIVWGGGDQRVSALQTGARYDPVTDTWRPMTTTGAPRARVQHTSVWTGTEMINFGGFEGGLILTSGGAYNPATDSWQLQTFDQAPQPRLGHCMVWTGTEMIVWGGVSDGFQPFDSGSRLNRTRDTWAAMTTASAPFARLGHTGVWTGQQLIVWGGYVSQGANDTGGRYSAIGH